MKSNKVYELRWISNTDSSVLSCYGILVLKLSFLPEHVQIGGSGSETQEAGSEERGRPSTSGEDSEWMKR